MTSALVPFTFNSIKLFTVTINGKHWTRAKEICESLEYNKVTSKTANLSELIAALKTSLKNAS